MPYRIFYQLFDNTACTYYRAYLPAAHLRPQLEARGIEVVASREFDGSNRFDAYVFGRIPDAATFAAAVRAYERGATIVWDLDDDMFAIPEWSPLHDDFGPIPLFYLEQGLKMATHITASTRRLADAISANYGAFAPKITVLENLIDIRPYFVDPRPRPGVAPFVKVLWTGSASHVGDLDPVVAFAEHIQRTPGFALVVYGYMPPRIAQLNADGSGIVHVPPTSKRNYESMLSLISPDVALMPLADVPFNACKSAIKFFECTMAGALCVATDAPPYSDAIAPEISGILVPHGDAGSWIDRIHDARRAGLVEDISQMKKNARREVIECYSWHVDSPRRRAWADFLASLAG